MIVQNKQLIEAYTLKHPTARNPFKRWIEIVEQADWRTIADLKNDFASVDYVGNGRFVFNIKGNGYRLVAVIVFVAGTVFVRWIGAQSEYDKINAETI